LGGGIFATIQTARRLLNNHDKSIASVLNNQANIDSVNE